MDDTSNDFAIALALQEELNFQDPRRLPVANEIEYDSPQEDEASDDGSSDNDEDIPHEEQDKYHYIFAHGGTHLSEEMETERTWRMVMHESLADLSERVEFQHLPRSQAIKRNVGLVKKPPQPREEPDRSTIKPRPFLNELVAARAAADEAGKVAITLVRNINHRERKVLLCVPPQSMEEFYTLANKRFNVRGKQKVHHAYLADGTVVNDVTLIPTEGVPIFVAGDEPFVQPKRKH